MVLSDAERLRLYTTVSDKLKAAFSQCRTVQPCDKPLWGTRCPHFPCNTDLDVLSHPMKPKLHNLLYIRVIPHLHFICFSSVIMLMLLLLVQLYRHTRMKAHWEPNTCPYSYAIPHCTHCTYIMFVCACVRVLACVYNACRSGTSSSLQPNWPITTNGQVSSHFLSGKEKDI